MKYSKLIIKKVFTPVLSGLLLTAGLMANSEGRNQGEAKPPVMKKEAVAPKSEVPMNAKLRYTSGAGETTLAELVKDKKAILLEFWATYCGPCKDLMPKLEEKAKKLPKYGIEVVAVTLDNKDEAEKYIKEKGYRFISVIEANTTDGGYSKVFGIEGIPHMVLISESGEVLFNGYPKDEDLEKALSKLGVKR